MQEVITKTIIILAALAAIVIVFNRLGRSKNPGCGCGCGSKTDAPCNDCSQASDCIDTPKDRQKSSTDA